MRISSSLDNLIEVDTFTEKIAEEMGFAPGQLADLGICVTEAVTNAIAHAHKFDESLQVEIDFEQLADGLRIRVRDHGPGFDVEELPDPRQPENILKDHGRGVLLIRALMDDVVIRRLTDGMVVEMIKRLSAQGR